MSKNLQKQIHISVIIPVYNAINTLERCLEGVKSSNYSQFELIIVDDGSDDGSQEVAKRYTDIVLESSTKQLGPSHARNRGAEIAKGDILFFIDADVVIKPDSLSKVAQTFLDHPDYDATFGSYDENPGSRDFLSQYKNLFHHFVHQEAHEEGDTFWSGCGAIRRQVFKEMGGFNVERYPRPSIEDIELGYRLRAAGYKIFVNKDLQVKHLKRWTLMGLLKTDVMDRAIPWTLLIMSERNIPNDLNLKTSQRLSALLLVILLTFLSFNAVVNQIWLLPLLFGLGILLVCGWQWNQGSNLFKMEWRIELLTYFLILVIGVLALYQGIPQLIPIISLLGVTIFIARFLPQSNGLLKIVFFTLMVTWLVIGFGLLFIGYSVWFVAPFFLILLMIVLFNYRLYLFFSRKRGISFTLAAIPFHFLYYLYSLIAFAIGGAIHIWNIGTRNRNFMGAK